MGNTRHAYIISVVKSPGKTSSWKTEERIILKSILSKKAVRI
jgi:hypothetical protein